LAVFDRPLSETLVDVAKHESHDQSTHGNWADGSTSEFSAGLSGSLEGTGLTVDSYAHLVKIDGAGVPIEVRSTAFDADPELIAAGVLQIQANAETYGMGLATKVVFMDSGDPGAMTDNPGAAGATGVKPVSGSSASRIEIQVYPNRLEGLMQGGSSLLARDGADQPEAMRRLITHETGHVIEARNIYDSYLATDKAPRENLAAGVFNDSRRSASEHRDVFSRELAGVGLQGKGASVEEAIAAGVTVPGIGFYALTKPQEFMAEAFTAHVHGIDVGDADPRGIGERVDMLGRTS
jgi:hypothetical protein